MISKETYINAIQDALPDMIKDKRMASEIIDTVFSVPMRALENGDQAELPGLGVISIDRGKGPDCLSFSPEQALLKCMSKGA